MSTFRVLRAALVVAGASLAMACGASPNSAPQAAATSGAQSGGASNDWTTLDATPPVSPEMATLEFYVGSWKCTGKDPRDDPKKPADVMRLEAHKVLGGRWISVRVFMDGKQMSDELKGWDAERKKFVHLFVDAQSSSGTLLSNGWSGDHLDFAEEVPSAQPARTVFTKTGERSFSHRWEMNEGKGFENVYDKTCMK